MRAKFDFCDHGKTIAIYEWISKDEQRFVVEISKRLFKSRLAYLFKN